MKVNLKDNIWIEGIINDGISRLLPTGVDYIYQGKTSEIPEELAKECLNTHYDGYCGRIYYGKMYNEFLSNNPIESIQSACPEKYCIIYKTK